MNLTYLHDDWFPAGAATGAMVVEEQLGGQHHRLGFSVKIRTQTFSLTSATSQEVGRQWPC